VPHSCRNSVVYPPRGLTPYIPSVSKCQGAARCAAKGICPTVLLSVSPPSPMLISFGCFISWLHPPYFIMVANPVVIVLLLNLVLVRGQLGPFINPPERPDGASPDGNTNPVYDVGNPLNITWTPVNGTASLTIWQTWPNGSDIGGLQYLPGSCTYISILNTSARRLLTSP
jgi:hypothetical protein